MQLSLQMINSVLYLSSSHRSEKRQRCSPSRAFQRQGGCHLHRVGRGLHGGGAGKTQPSEGDAAFTQGICTRTTCHLPALEALPLLWSHHVRCQMKFIKLSARAINRGCLLCQEQLCLTQRTTVIEQNLTLPRMLCIDPGGLPSVCAWGSLGKGLSPSRCLYKRSEWLDKVQPSSAWRAPLTATLTLILTKESSSHCSLHWVWPLLVPVLQCRHFIEWAHRLNLIPLPKGPFLCTIY